MGSTVPGDIYREPPALYPFWNKVNREGGKEEGEGKAGGGIEEGAGSLGPEAWQRGHRNVDAGPRARPRGRALSVRMGLCVRGGRVSSPPGLSAQGCGQEVLPGTKVGQEHGPRSSYLGVG